MHSPVSSLMEFWWYMSESSQLYVTASVDSVSVWAKKWSMNAREFNRHKTLIRQSALPPPLELQLQSVINNLQSHPSHRNNKTVYDLQSMAGRRAKMNAICTLEPRSNGLLHNYQNARGWSSTGALISCSSMISHLSILSSTQKAAFQAHTTVRSSALLSFHTTVSTWIDTGWRLRLLLEDKADTFRVIISEFLPRMKLRAFNDASIEFV